MEGEREEKQGPGIVGAGQNIYNMARLFSRAGRAGRAVAALAATSGIWGPVAIALVIVLVPTFLIVMGGPGTASETSPQQAQQTTGTAEISSLFNLTGATQTSEEFIEIQNILAPALSYPNYKKLLTERGPINLIFDDTPRCGAKVDIKGDITIFGFERCDKEFRRYAFIHETGHIIHARNGYVAQSFTHSDFIKLDSSCYDSRGYLKSYPHTKDEGTAFDESLAEAIAMSLIKQNAPFKDFPKECPNTYDWIWSNIFQKGAFQ